MTVEEKIALLEEDLELDPGTLTLETDLSEIDEWDSMAYLSFSVLVEDNFGTQVIPGELKSCKKVADLVALMK